MSDRERPADVETAENDGDGEAPSKGPSLTLLYSIVALAIIAAIGFAALIVLPFYQRR